MFDWAISYPSFGVRPGDLVVTLARRCWLALCWRLGWARPLNGPDAGGVGCLSFFLFSDLEADWAGPPGTAGRGDSRERFWLKRQRISGHLWGPN
jgi:hypothetical protein